MYLCQYIDVLYTNVIHNKEMNDKPVTPKEDELNRRRQLQKWIDENYDGKQAGFIKKTRSNQGEISALLRGVKAFGERKARALENVAGMPEKYLEQRTDDVEVVFVTPHNADEGDIVIYEFDVQGAMGGGLTLPEQPGVIKKWHVSDEWAKRNIPANTGLHNLCIVTGFGDSMKPMFNPGDPLIVDTGVNNIEYDATYFFRVGNEGFIKRIQRVPGVGRVVISENKAFEKWVLRDDMDYEIFGRVLKVWRGDDL